MKGFNDNDSERDFGDRTMYKATCSDCGKECEVPFQPTEGKPVRCQDCFRKSRPAKRSFGGNRFGGRSSGFNRGFNDGPRKMYKATCSDCGKECEVPFKPMEGKKVRCKDCFRKSKEENSESF
jgi:CxxC-x17-CxxC domain-containing protein